MNHILLSELREKIEDSNAYCDIYEIDTPALHVIMIPHYSIDNNATENKIMWQLPSGKIIPLKEQLRHISIEEISTILQFNDINTTIQYMSRATDAQIAAIIIQYEKQYLDESMYTFNYFERSDIESFDKKQNVLDYYSDYNLNKIEDNKYTFDYLNNRFVLTLKETSFSVAWQAKAQ